MSVSKDSLSCLLILSLLPFAAAWENVGIRELSASHKDRKLQEIEEEKRINDELSSLKLSPLRIIQKMNSAMLEAEGMKCKMDIWLQHPAFHTNIHLDQDLQSLDKIHITGRTSFSLLVPGTRFSTSEWIQSYSLGARSFIFDPEKNRWEKEKLKLSKEKELEMAEYGLFQSLAAPKSDFVLEDTVKLVSLQRYKGRDCLVLSFTLEPDFFKQWNVTGKVDNYKAWVDGKNYYPYLFRLEGSIGDAKFLQLVEYSDYDTNVTLKLPAEVTKEMEKEDKDLIQKTNDFIEKIKTLRGGSPPEALKISFTDRKKLRKYLKENIAQENNPQELRAQELIFKWLKLMPEDFDYKEMLVNSSTSSIAGYYEPKEKAFYITDWIPEYLVEPVLSHELMHAFQDNEIGLEDFLKKQKTLDELFARKFLIEGEATAVMLQFVFEKQNKDFQDDNDLLSTIKEKLSSGASCGYSNLTYSGYAYGARFIQRALNKGGWRNLSSFYKEPPQGMREIMHPETYFEKKRAPGKQKNNVPALKGWQEFYRDSLGEFIVKTWLEKYFEGTEAEILAESLKNDEIVLYSGQNKEKPLIVFLTEWETEENAKKFWDALLKTQDKKLGEKAKKTQEDNFMAWQSENGYYLIAINQNMVLIADAPLIEKENIDTLLGTIRNS